tara:strand:+ start:794 stop:1657 length:864 start_codon:yes stop_codon:yes gene_type:complete
MGLIETFTFKGKNVGPHILLTGRVHGNEPAGEYALKRLKGRLETGDITLKCGQVTIMPCCNPDAAKENKRFIDMNLNRIMSADHIKTHQNANEANLAAEIISRIDECDMSVDFHTFTEHMPPVVICIDDQNETCRALAKSCGIKRIECDSPFLSAPGTQMLLHYARHHNKPAILIESGQHEDQDAVETAWHALLNILITQGVIDGVPHCEDTHEFLIMRSALYRREGEELAFDLMGQDRINHGDPLFKIADGTLIRADIGGLLFMRNANTPIGEEYAYLCDVLDDWP